MISDGVNTKAGSFFAKYDFFYAWRKTEGMPNEVDGIDAMFTMIQGMFNRERFRNIIQNFIFLPDSSKKNEKIVCRYPQYYATIKLFENIKIHQNQKATEKEERILGLQVVVKVIRCFLARMLMKSTYFKSPTIV